MRLFKKSALISRGNKARDNKDWREAIDAYAAYLQVNPDSAGIWVQYGHVLKEDGQLEQAEAAYRMAMEKAPNDADAQLHHAHILKRMGRREEAEAAFQRLLELLPGDVGAAQELRVLQQVDTEAPQDPKPAGRGSNPGQEASLVGRLHSPLLRPLDKASSEQLLYQADCAREQSDWNTAIACYREYLKTHKKNAAVHVQWAHALKEGRQFDAAISAYQRAAELAPEDADPLLHLAHLFMRLGKFDDAAKTFARLLALRPQLGAQAICDVLTHWAACEAKEERYNTAVQLVLMGFVLHANAAVQTALSRWIRQSSYASIAQVHEALQAGDAGRSLPVWLVSDMAAWKAAMGVRGIAGNMLYLWAWGEKAAHKLGQLEVSIDGSALELPVANVPDICLAGINGICETAWQLPDCILDGQPHRIVVRDSGSETELYCFDGRIDFRIGVVSPGGGQLHCWSASFNTPCLPLPVQLGGRHLPASLLSRDIRFSQDRARALGLAHPSVLEYVFDVPGGRDALPATIEARPLGSCVASDEGTHWNLGLADAVSGLQSLSALTASSPMPEVTRRWLVKQLLPSLIERLREQGVDAQDALHCPARLGRIEPAAFETSAVVDVIVPVYKDIEATQHCLHGLLRAVNRSQCNIVVIDDASPEPALKRWLKEFCQAHEIRLITHGENRGFVASVNEGMSLHPDRDVVLLNADAVVSDAWLDGLRSAAICQPRVASVTPLSNNATIFSYPVMGADQPHPDDVSRSELAQMAASVNAGRVVETPTCHGFCVYLRREALVDVGLFDEKTFERGYGEETDWSVRARDRGWIHLAAPASYVEHLGSRSFGSDREEILQRSNRIISQKYPEYDRLIQTFFSQDPLAASRRRLDWARLGRLPAPEILHISHNLGGGTEKFVIDQMRRMAPLGSLCLQPAQALAANQVVLSSSQIRMRAAYQIQDEFSLLVAELKSLGLKSVHVHHLIGYPAGFVSRLLQELGLPYTVTLHDYSAVCPRIFLCRPQGEYCDGPHRESQCSACMRRYGPKAETEALFNEWGGTYSAWRNAWQELMQNAERVITPTQDQAERMAENLQGCHVEVQAHPENEFPAAKRVSPAKRKFTVSLLGGLSWEKGAGLLHELAAVARDELDAVEFVVIGDVEPQSHVRRFSHVHVHGAYDNAECGKLLKKYDTDVVLFLSVWPETWCYTLSEALEQGYPVVAPRLGSFSQRLSGLPGHRLYEPGEGVDGIAAALASIISED